MVKPDLEMVHEKSGRIYYNGIILDINKMDAGWVLTHQSDFDIIHATDTVEEMLAWLPTQRVAS